jgi:hypothetical protein
LKVWASIHDAFLLLPVSELLTFLKPLIKEHSQLLMETKGISPSIPSCA